jgi:putative endonuclease
MLVIPAKAGIYFRHGSRPAPDDEGEEARVFYVYLLGSRPYRTLYVGVTSDLVKRVFEHKCKVVPGFTYRYGVNKLVWFESHDAVESAIRREKQIKEWQRIGKLI